MICFIHGYGLSGSGSNRWSQSVLARLCALGETVHVVCQDARPERYDFVAAAFEHARDGTAEPLFERDVPYDGKCILHRPRLAVLPTYVRPTRASETVKSILDLDDDALDDYVSRLEATLHHLVDAYGITGIHVNHLVLASEAARRVAAETGVPFAVMPHGSAIEYVVKQDARMRDVAADVLTACQRILILSPEMRERILTLFPEVADAEAKMVDTNVGVDTDLFEVVGHDERPAQIERMKKAIAGVGRGRTLAQMAGLRARLVDDMSEAALGTALKETSGTRTEGPDEDLEARLDAVDWRRDDVVAFVGALLTHKGVPALVAAFPSILAARPDTRLLVVGSGPLREPLEAFVEALRSGHRTLARNIARWGDPQDDDAEPFESVVRYFDQLDADGELDAYFAQAEQHLADPNRVVFTGYLEHDALSALLPACDVGVFPSRVAEAGPMVFLEAMASGAFPLGTYFAGMKAKIDTAARVLPADVADRMKLRPDADHLVRDIAANAAAALAYGEELRGALRSVAVDHYDWRIIARQMSRIYDDLVPTRS